MEFCTLFAPLFYTFFSLSGTYEQGPLRHFLLKGADPWAHSGGLSTNSETGDIPASGFLNLEC